MKHTITLLLAVCIGLSCNKGTPAMNKKNDDVAVDRRIEKLRDLITLSITPEEVWFETVPLGIPGGLGPTDYQLIAIMRFERADLTRITTAAHRSPGSLPRISTTENRPWFPEPVKAAIRPYDDHRVTVRGDKFDAAPFAKSPFLSGIFVAVEGGEYVILVLQTM